MTLGIGHEHRELLRVRLLLRSLAEWQTQPTTNDARGGWTGGVAVMTSGLALVNCIERVWNTSDLALSGMGLRPYQIGFHDAVGLAVGV